MAGTVAYVANGQFGRQVLRVSRAAPIAEKQDLAPCRQAVRADIHQRIEWRAQLRPRCSHDGGMLLEFVIKEG